MTRGFAASVIGAGPQGGLRLSTYEYSKSLLSSKHLNDNSSPTLLKICGISALSAILGDLVSSIVKVPREVVTSRLQVNADLAAITRNPSSNPVLITMKEVIKEQGIGGLFRGFWYDLILD